VHLNYYDSTYNRGRQLSHRKTKLKSNMTKKACTFNTYNIINTKNKARFSRLLRKLAWKWNETILVKWEGMQKQKNT